MSEQKDIVSRENVFNNGFIALEQVNFKKEGHEPYSHVRVVKKDAVAGLLLDYNTREYIFVKQFRTGANEPIIEVVAGTLDVDGEDPIECLRREIQEEVGLNMTMAEKIGCFYTSPGVSNERIHVFFAMTDGTVIADGGGVGHEKIEIVRFTRDQVRECWDELSKDMKTFLALTQYGYTKLLYTHTTTD